MRNFTLLSTRVGRAIVFGIAAALASACASHAPVTTTATPVASDMASGLTTTSARSTGSATPVSITTPPTYRKEFGTMWTFDAPPLDYWKQTYNFVPPAGWLDNIRLASVRLPGCSASFVSSQGLVMTNHHCGRECTAGVSPKDTNYIETGFTAKNLADEKKCDGMTVDQLQSIEDVTPQIRSAVTGTTDSAKAAQTAATIKTMEQSCSAQGGLHCQVVTLYNGGRYSLYRYKRFTDVRLVMAPEEAAAFFGGDPDNFTFPRYDLDLTLLRVYENGVPYKPANYLRWSANGAASGELVFVTGNPGSTERLSTMAQLELNRDVVYPITLRSYLRNLAFLQGQIAKNPALQRTYQNDIFGLQNSYKAVSGFERGLRDSSLMARKRAFEAEVRARVAANPTLQSQYGAAWDAIARAARDEAEVYPRLSFYFGSRTALPSLARAVIHAARTKDDPASAQLIAQLGQPQTIDTMNADNLVTGLTLQLNDAIAVLPANDPYLALVLNGETPAAAAARLVNGTQLRSPEFRRTLVAGGAAAVNSSTDPFIALMRHEDSLVDPLRQKYVEADAIIKTNSALVGRALYDVYGTILPPDATFTLRITDGVVKGYPYNGSEAPYKTTFYGAFGHANDFDNKWPFALPPRWVAARNKINLATPLDFVSTNDIIGGNSGSPVINTKGEVVGLIFDGNIESLPDRFVFTDEAARSVSVHSAAIIEALRNIYDANRIADELQGKSNTTTSASANK